MRTADVAWVNFEGDSRKARVVRYSVEWDGIAFVCVTGITAPACALYTPHPTSRLRHRLAFCRRQTEAIAFPFSVVPRWPQPFFNEIAGLETSSRPYLLKCGAPCHPDVIVRWSLAKKKLHEDPLFIAFFLLVSSCHETSVEENGWFCVGAVVESVFSSAFSSSSSCPPPGPFPSSPSPLAPLYVRTEIFF